MNVIFKTFVEGDRTIVTSNFELEIETKLEATRIDPLTEIYHLNLVTPTNKVVLYNSTDELYILDMYSRLVERISAIYRGDEVSNFIDMHSF